MGVTVYRYCNNKLNIGALFWVTFLKWQNKLRLRCGKPFFYQKYRELKFIYETFSFFYEIIYMSHETFEIVSYKYKIQIKNTWKKFIRILSLNWFYLLERAPVFEINKHKNTIFWIFPKGKKSTSLFWIFWNFSLKI